MIPLRELDIAKTCSDLLQHDQWRLLVTDPVSNRQLGKGFGEPGMADRLFMRYGVTPAAEVLWIEFKRIRPGHKAPTKPTPLQMQWHTHERALGAMTWIAGVDFEATIEGFIHHYNQSGLARIKF